MISRDSRQFLTFLASVVIIAFMLGCSAFVMLRFTYAIEGSKYGLIRQAIEYIRQFIVNNLVFYSFACLALGSLGMALWGLTDNDRENS